MFPLILDPAKATILVIGNGPATQRRMELLKEAGVQYTHFRHPRESGDLNLQDSRFRGNDTENHSTINHQPSTIVFAADLDDATSARLYHDAKAAGCLVNVEDKRDYCDFHVPAIVRRGDLLLTVSTNAASPRLARRLRMLLEQLFPAHWAERLQTIRAHREQWKTEGATFAQVAAKTDALLDKEGWLEENTSLRGAEGDSAISSNEARGSRLPRSGFASARNDEVGT